MVNAYDALVIGPVSLGQNIDWLGVERCKAGGAQRQNGCPSARSATHRSNCYDSQRLAFATRPVMQPLLLHGTSIHILLKN